MAFLYFYQFITNSCSTLQVAFVGDCIGTEVQRKVDALLTGQILMLENTRFHDGETANDPEFAAQVRRWSTVGGQQVVAHLRLVLYQPQITCPALCSWRPQQTSLSWTHSAAHTVRMRPPRGWRSSCAPPLLACCSRRCVFPGCL